MEARIASGLTALGLTPPAGAAARLAEYGRLLLEQNQVMNLTAITEPDQVADLHFLDSAALLTLGEDLRSKRLIDVGTGAGFPGLPLRILEPSLQLTLLDSLGKRVNWLASVCDTLGLEGVECLHARAEEQAAELTRQQLRQAEQTCGEMKQQAQSRLKQAAAMIEEKVVSD